MLFNTNSSIPKEQSTLAPIPNPRPRKSAQIASTRAPLVHGGTVSLNARQSPTSDMNEHTMYPVCLRGEGLWLSFCLGLCVCLALLFPEHDEWWTQYLRCAIAFSLTDDSATRIRGSTLSLSRAT